MHGGRVHSPQRVKAISNEESARAKLGSQQLPYDRRLGRRMGSSGGSSSPTCTPSGRIDRQIGRRAGRGDDPSWITSRLLPGDVEAMPEVSHSSHHNKGSIQH